MFTEFINITNIINGSIIEAISPLTVTLNTSEFQSTDKIWKIVYDFGNTRSQTVEFSPKLTNDFDTFIPDEPGDPRNVLVTTQYFFDDAPTKSYNITVQFYKIGITAPEIVSFTLSLKLPNMLDMFESVDSLKLVGSRMFGLDNRILYLFESQNTHYLLPVLAQA